MTVATVGSQVLFAGGFRGARADASASSRVDIYDSATGTWTIAELSSSRGLLATATVGSRVIFAGGGDLYGGPDATLDVYDSTTGRWTSAQLPQGGRTLAGAAVGTSAFFAGGEMPSHPAGVVDIIDASAP
jgi:hypothetical protein